jgi:LysM repeat protein
MVQPGDTLSGIAASHGASLAAVEAANPQLANPNLIFAGQAVKIPAGGSSAAGAATATAQAPVAHTYTSTSHASSYGSSTQRSSSYYGSTQRTATTYHSPSSTASVAHTSTGSSGYSSGGSLSSISGVPQSFAACVAYHESTNGTNQAYNGGVYGIITASGINVNGQSVAAQKAAFSKLYAEYGTKPWAGDGCA